MSQETEGLQRVTLDERPSKEMPNQEVSDSSVSPGYIHKLLPKIQKTNDDSLKPTVWKIEDITYVIQVGKLEDVWSDAIIIFGKDQYSLPRTFVEKVGPHIQREFKDKYPNGLCKEEVAVLSGFNLPTWKIFYCDCTFIDIKECLKMADKLKMKSILFLVQEELLTISSEFDFFMIHFCVHFASISTVYFHVDQDTLEWRKLRKTAEDILFTRKGFVKENLSDVNSLPENPKPKVFHVGHNTVAIQVGKLEEIQSEAVVIFEAATGQWPTQNLPSEILEKAGPMIQREFTEKFPAGLEYAEVAVLNGHNLPFRKILYGVFPRWPVPWVKQVMAVFLTECFQLASDEGMKSIVYLIPSVSYHIAELYTSVFYEMLIYDVYSLNISTKNIVIKDGCTVANMLQKVFQDEWASKRVFKEGHVTVVTGNCFLQDIVMRRRKATQTSAKLSEGSQEKAIVPKSKALVIISKLQDFTDVLEEIDPSLKEEFRTKYSSVLPNDKVAILDGDNNPLNKIYWGNCTSEIEIPDIILECFQMAENDKINSIILQIRPHGAIEVMDLGQELILGLRIFAIENPFYGIRRLYYDTWFRQKTLKRMFRFQSEVTTSVKVFKESHVTVALNATYNEMGYTHGLHCSYPQRLGHKSYRYDVCSEAVYSDVYHWGIQVHDMDMFFFKCMQEADGNGVSSVTFLVPKTVRRSIALFASTLISCVKRFAKETPSSSIKRIYIRIEKSIAKYHYAKQIFEKEWARTSGGKQGYPSEDIYLKKKLSISELPGKSKEGSKYVSEEDVIFEEKWARTSGGKQGYPSEDMYLKKKLNIFKLPEKSKESSEHVSQEDVIFDVKWARTSGGSFVRKGRTSHIPRLSHRSYPSEDIYLKKKMSISELPEKSKEGSKYVSQEDVISEKKWARTSRGYPSEDIYLKKKMSISELLEKSKEDSKYVSQEDVISEKEWSSTSGEDSPGYLSVCIDESLEKHQGKQGYPSEDIYLKKKMSISELPEKSKEGSKYVSQEDVISEKEWSSTSGGKQGYPPEDIYLKKKMSISELPEKSKEGSKYVSQEDVDWLPHESSK